MAIEVLPIPLPPTANAAKCGQMGRVVKGVSPGTATEEQLKEIHDLLYKVSGFLANPRTCDAETVLVKHDILLFQDCSLTPEQQYKLAKVRGFMFRLHSLCLRSRSVL